MAQFHVTGDRWNRPSKWLLVPLLALAVLLLAIIGQNATNNPVRDRDRLPDAPLAYSGSVWVPAGPVELLPDRQMVRVGHTVDGTDLYARPALPGGGGGVAQPQAQPMSAAYMRVGQDQYQALALVHVPTQQP